MLKTRNLLPRIGSAHPHNEGFTTSQPASISVSPLRMDRNQVQCTTSRPRCSRDLQHAPLLPLLHRRNGSAHLYKKGHTSSQRASPSPSPLPMGSEGNLSLYSLVQGASHRVCLLRASLSLARLRVGSEYNLHRYTLVQEATGRGYK